MLGRLQAVAIFHVEFSGDDSQIDLIHFDLAIDHLALQNPTLTPDCNKWTISEMVRQFLPVFPLTIGSLGDSDQIVYLLR